MYESVQCGAAEAGMEKRGSGQCGLAHLFLELRAQRAAAPCETFCLYDRVQELTPSTP
jgi:hypothetical protein